MTRDVDVLVAGGGPAGLATAIRAAGAGLRVVVVEPRTGAIDKACGEGLMPGAVAALAALGVHPSGHPLRGIRYVDGDAAVTADFSAGPGLGVRRTTLHDALRARVDELGVAVETGTVRDVRQTGGTVVDGAGRRARYLVAADGLHSPTRAALGLDLPSRGVPRYGVRRHYAVAPWSDHVEVHWAPDFEAYVTPVAPDLVGVAVLGPRGTRVDQALDALPALRSRLAAGAPGADRGAGPLRRRARSRVAGRVLLVGDAAGYVDAITGEGIRLALAEADAVVDAILGDDPAGYERRWRRITAQYRLGTGLLLGCASRPAVRRRVVPAAARFPSVFGRFVDVLADGPGGSPRAGTAVRA